MTISASSVRNSFSMPKSLPCLMDLLMNLLRIYPWSRLEGAIPKSSPNMNVDAFIWSVIIRIESSCFSLVVCIFASSFIFSIIGVNVSISYTVFLP